MGMGRAILAAVAFIVIAGATALWLSPAARLALATAIHPESRTPSASHGHAHGNGDHHGPPGVLKLSTEQITNAKIELAPAGAGTLTRRITVPGTIAPDADRIGRVAAKVVGTVAELRKRLGDPVALGEVIAVLESREVADAKSEYLAALVQFELQQTLFERDQTLWERKIIAEQQFLRSRTAFAHAQVRVDTARQKLFALDLGVDEVANLRDQPIEALRRKEIRAPIAGRVVERRVNLGTPVGGESQEHELYVIADLSSVWIDLAISMGDLPSVREGLPVSVVSGAKDVREGGRIVFISPMLNPETRSARAIALIENPDLALRPGFFVMASVTVENMEVELRIPRSALQTIANEKVVFVRTAEGFERREVVLGRDDGRFVEIVFGLDPGETIAVTNTFVLKAELLKSEADHGHAH